MRTKTIVFTVFAVVLAIAGYLVGKRNGSGGDDAPIIVSGGSLHILASPGSTGDDKKKHAYSLGPDGGNAYGLAHWTNGKQTGKSNGARAISQVEVSYYDSGKRASDTWAPTPQHVNDPVTIKFGYCVVNSLYCDSSGKADDVVTAYSDQQSLIFKSVQKDGTTQNDMTKDEQVFDEFWNHQPNNSLLSWVTINGKSYACSPGNVECIVVIHFCEGKC